ncbi:hypothetical protein ID866_8009, partial [Astraeus odoratus]
RCEEEEEQGAHEEAEQKAQEEVEQKRKEEEGWRAEEARSSLQALLQGKSLLQLVEDCWKEEDDGDFTVLAALTEEHRDELGTLMTTVSALLKEFKGYCYKQWDLQAHQVRGLKALQKEMKKVNALKVKELEVITKGKEKAVEPSEELLESGDEEEEVKGKVSDKGEVVKGDGEVVKGDGSNEDVEMGAAPSASAT